MTPIIKATKGATTKSFFSIPEYNEWRQANNNGRGWKIKYYKGLGTSNELEAKEYFAAVDEHAVDFAYQGPVDDEAIELVRRCCCWRRRLTLRWRQAFAKEHADRRKEWIRLVRRAAPRRLAADVSGRPQHDPEAYVDHRAGPLTYKTFVDKELVLVRTRGVGVRRVVIVVAQFSRADCERSIPSFVDGLKPGAPQRRRWRRCVTTSSASRPAQDPLCLLQAPPRRRL